MISHGVGLLLLTWVDHWFAIAAFVVMTVMLSLLIFIGEAVRDAFDPRKLVGR